MARKATKAITKSETVAPEKPRRASRKTTPSPETLAPLGLDRLVGLVLDETARNPAFKKLVTAAIAGLQGPDAVAALVDRRLTALERAHGYIDWQKRRSFAADLDATVSTIVSELASLDVGAALDRLIRFIGGAQGVLERVDDSSGQVVGIYERATHAAADLALRLPPAEAAGLAIKLVPLLDADGFGILDALLLTVVEGLPETALEPIDAALASATPDELPASGKAAAKSAVLNTKAWDRKMQRMRLLRMRQALADRRGDVAAFISLEQAISPDHPDVVAVAERLLSANRAAEALDWIGRPQKRGIVVVTREQMLTGSFDPEAPRRERDGLEIRILDALGRKDEAQGKRLARFETSLDREMLRDYVAKLPDFEDEEALERAFDHAAAHADAYRALHFLVHWPKLDRAARLVLDRSDAWDGNRYEILAPAAEALEEAHPVAASLLYRRMIDDMLSKGRSSAYGYGARHLVALDALARRLEPGDLTPDHTAYREALRKTHGRKSAFWEKVKG
ncbi:DUF6880 family protein [Methylobacterium marchantiae]|uniref:DUF6880 family protein n=1 Tax=Methylobacterium marchantiae TaxID=600331 RepID=A0ABW3X195_9HYPH|nr:hypothetical protein AIGOOFII_2408 [Methylobacterium marchantiae]